VAGAGLPLRQRRPDGARLFSTLVGGLLTILGRLSPYAAWRYPAKNPVAFTAALILVLGRCRSVRFALERLGLMIAIFTLVVFPPWAEPNSESAGC